MVDFNKLKVTVLEETKDYGKFEIGPMARGFGHTLANPLRRVMLSSLEGSAVTGVKIAGVKHEFTTLKGMKEDVLQTVLNLKEMRVACFSDEPKVLTLSAKGKGEVKAGDLKLPGDVEIIDPDFVIATLADDKSKLELEVTVEKGIGYRGADDATRKDLGYLPLDANFSPVERVKFEIAETRVGRRTDLDKVILEVYTDGSVKPERTVTEACEILVNLYATLAGESEVVTRIIERKESGISEEDEQEAADEVPQLKVDEIDLPARALNSLKGAGIEMVSDLVMMSTKEVEALEGLGKKSVEDIEKALAKQGLGLKE